MSTFADYASCYDLLYREKDYAGEARFVSDVMQASAPGASSLLDLGCGTARHAIEFARLGYRVTGVDLSPNMVAVAHAALAGQPAQVRSQVTISQGDATLYQPKCPFDAVLSLFHVVNYQVSDAALFAMFQAARRGLDAGGVFIFDFWHGAGVLADRPATRTRFAETEEMTVVRAAQPVLDMERQVVSVRYRVTVTEKLSGRSRAFEEVHDVRYLFVPEIEELAGATGFALSASGQWCSHQAIAQDSWHGWAALQAV